MSTINCPACGHENKDDRATCENCGVNFARLAVKPVQQVETEAAKKRPILGFLGLLLLGVGFCSLLLEGYTFGTWTMVIGGGLLAYALFTGNLSFMGRGR